MKKKILAAVKAASSKTHGIRRGKPQGTKRGAKGYKRQRDKKALE